MKNNLKAILTLFREKKYLGIKNNQTNKFTINIIKTNGEEK